MAGLIEEDLISHGQQDSRKGQEIACKLDIVEVLYVLASKPGTVSDLNSRLRATFGFEMEFSRSREVIEILDSRKLVRKFSNYQSENHSAVSSQEAFSITPAGLTKLDEWLQSLSEITLTMQLGLDQRILVSEE